MTDTCDQCESPLTTAVLYCPECAAVFCCAYCRAEHSCIEVEAERQEDAR